MCNILSKFGERTFEELILWIENIIQTLLKFNFYAIHIYIYIKCNNATNTCYKIFYVYFNFISFEIFISFISLIFWRLLNLYWKKKSIGLIRDRIQIFCLLDILIRSYVIFHVIFYISIIHSKKVEWFIFFKASITLFLLLNNKFYKIKIFSKLIIFKHTFINN